MRKSLAAVGVVFGVIGSMAAGGCSSSPPPITSFEFCQQKAEAECNMEVTGLCEVDQSACITTRAAMCNSYATTATSTGTRAFNSANVPACLAAINNAYGNLSESDTVLQYTELHGDETKTGTVEYICDSVYQGVVPAQGTCTSSFDCLNNNVCTPANGGAKTQVCAPANQVSDGMPCGAAGDICVPGDICKANANQEYLCEPGGAELGGRGAPCKTDSQCDPDTAGFCDIYQGTGCQPNLEFATKDCQLYGQAASK